MSIFDVLIDKDSINPLPNEEYVYLLDEAWVDNELKSHSIDKYSTVDNVVKNDNGSFSFRVVETGEIFKTNYNWSLVLKTPENLEVLNKYLKAQDDFNAAKIKMEQIRTEMVTLEKKLLDK